MSFSNRFGVLPCLSFVKDSDVFLTMKDHLLGTTLVTFQHLFGATLVTFISLSRKDFCAFIGLELAEIRLNTFSDKRPFEQVH